MTTRKLNVAYTDAPTYSVPRKGPKGRFNVKTKFMHPPYPMRVADMARQHGIKKAQLDRTLHRIGLSMATTAPDLFARLAQEFGRAEKRGKIAWLDFAFLNEMQPTEAEDKTWSRSSKPP